MRLAQAAHLLGAGGGSSGEMWLSRFHVSQAPSLPRKHWHSSPLLRSWKVQVSKLGVPRKSRHGDMSARALGRPSSKAQQGPVVEHVVFFKIKEEAGAEEAFQELQTLKSLDVVAGLSASRVQRAVGADYTHALHSRHADKAALGAYAVHPSHVAIVKRLFPFVEDSMAVDWEAVPVGAAVEGGGYIAARITLMKLLDGAAEDFADLFDSLNGLRDKFSSIRQISVGENFSPARAKGFNVGFAALFDDAEELRRLDESSQLHGELKKVSISPFLESFVIVDIHV